MLSTPMRQMLLAIFAAIGLTFGIACEPGTYNDATQRQQTTDDQTGTGTMDQDSPTMGGTDDQDEPFGGGPAYEGSETEMPQDDMAAPQADQDGFDRGLDNIEQGLDDLRQEAESRADQVGETVDERVEDIQQRVQQFSEEIRQDIQDLRQQESQDQTGTGSGPVIDSDEPAGEPAPRDRPVQEEPSTDPQDSATY